MKLYLVVIILFSSLFKQICSQINELPIHFGHYFNDPQINPAKGGGKSDIEAYNGNRRNQGSFGGIKTSYLSAFFRLKESKGSFHTLGFSFNNDREGSSIARNRVYLSYSRHQKLSDSWKLSAGLSGGMYNFSVKSNPVIGGASAGTVDLNLGVNLYSKSTSIGVSINQLNEGDVQPFIQVIKLVTQYNFIADHKFEVGKNLKITPSFFYRYANLENKELNSRFGFSSNFLITKHINIGASYELKEGAYTFLGLHNIPLFQSEKKTIYSKVLNIDFSYFIPSANNTRTNINAYELSLKYFFNRNNK